jgi:hypothetical protein
MHLLLYAPDHLLGDMGSGDPHIIHVNRQSISMLAADVLYLQPHPFMRII